MGRSAIVLTCAGMAFALDQGTKYWVVFALDLRSRLTLEAFPPLLNLRMGWNTGANFGLGDWLSAWFWIGLALVISAALFVWTFRMRDRLRIASAGLVIGGALGNALDRYLHGAVADFMNTTCCGFDNPYAYNMADVFIFLGALGLILRDGEARASDGART